MPLIRFLGPMTLPLAYRRYIREEVVNFKRNRKESHEPYLWNQEFLAAPDDKNSAHYRTRQYYFDDGVVVVQKPFQCRKLAAKLAELYSGTQQHG